MYYTTCTGFALVEGKKERERERGNKALPLVSVGFPVGRSSCPSLPRLIGELHDDHTTLTSG